MPHARLLPFDPAPAARGPVAGAVRCGSRVFLSARSALRSDGSVATFTVTAREQYDKDAFPTDKVYGPTSSPQLRVITCGGSFDWNTRHYNDNVVVFADLQRIT